MHILLDSDNESTVFQHRKPYSDNYEKTLSIIFITLFTGINHCRSRGAIGPINA